MNKFISLTKIQLKDFAGRYRSGLNLNNNLLARIIPLFFLIILFIPSVNYSLLTFNIFEKIGQPELVITSIYVNSVVLMFILGIPFIISVFFFSKDLKFLITLPVNEKNLILAKLTTVYLYLFIVNTLLVGPALVIYGINTSFDLTFLIALILALIFAPLLPLLISALLTLIFTGFFVKGNKNLFLLAGNFLMLTGIIGVQIGLNRYISNPEILQEAILNKNGLIGLIGLRFPPSIWLTKMMTGSAKETLLFLGLNLIFLFILTLLAGIFFRKSLISFNEGTGSLAKKIYFKKRSRGWQLLKRNILIIVREPTFLMNTLLSLIVPVLLFVFMSLSGDISLNLLVSKQLKPYMLIIFTGIITSPAIIANLSATAITREGRAFWETKVLPISPVENLRYRILTTVFLNFLGSALLLIISLIFLPLNFKIICLGVSFCIVTTMFLATADIIINIYRPLLNWTHPTAAVKNNLNIVISLGFRALIAFLITLLFKLRPDFFKEPDLVVALFTLLFLLLYLLVKKLVYGYFSEKFARIN